MGCKNNQQTLKAVLESHTYEIFSRPLYIGLPTPIRDNFILYSPKEGEGGGGGGGGGGRGGQGLYITFGNIKYW